MRKKQTSKNNYLELMFFIFYEKDLPHNMEFSNRVR